MLQSANGVLLPVSPVPRRRRRIRQCGQSISLTVKGIHQRKTITLERHGRSIANVSPCRQPRNPTCTYVATSLATRSSKVGAPYRVRSLGSGTFGQAFLCAHDARRPIRGNGGGGAAIEGGVGSREQCGRVLSTRRRRRRWR
jgi:hypothetical protein